MPMDATFFEKYLVIYKMDCASDHSHGMGLQWKLGSGLFFFVGLDIDCFSGLLWLFDS